MLPGYSGLADTVHEQRISSPASVTGRQVRELGGPGVGWIQARVHDLLVRLLGRVGWVCDSSPVDGEETGGTPDFGARVAGSGGAMSSRGDVPQGSGVGGPRDVPGLVAGAHLVRSVVERPTASWRFHATTQRERRASAGP